MIVAGGVYIETCVTPQTRQLLGSGGRAALGLSSLRNDITLHTFHPPEFWGDIEANFRPYGIDCKPSASNQRIEFAYLFPLASPVQSPGAVAERIEKLVAGDSVLRFGCVEGDFIIQARQAVFDPQGTASWHFRERGGAAERLALVMNAAEAFAATGATGIDEAASRVLATQGAEVAVVKDGPRGAHVFSNGQVQHVPAYASRSNYKIGSGDVFSAIFAHHWFAGLSPASAADHASRYTAAYVETPTLPFPKTSPRLVPRRNLGVECIVVITALNTVADRWFANILCAAIIRLGVDEVELIAIEKVLQNNAQPVSRDATILVCAEDRQIALAVAKHRSLKEYETTIFLDATVSKVSTSDARIFNDLTQAIYEVFWLPE